MDTTPSRSSNPTFDRPSHHWYRESQIRSERPQAQQGEDSEKKSQTPPDMHGRAVMRKAHGIFHRRQGQATNVLTVNVEVINSVDPDGKIVAQQTVTPAAPTVAAVPSVPAVPPPPALSVPTVPAVPAFPSDLTVPTVPGYPFVSDAAVPSASSAQQPITSGTPAPAPTSALTSSNSNSTFSSAPSSSSLSSSINSTNSTITSSSSSSSSTQSSRSSSSTSTSLSSSSSSRTGSTISSASASSSAYGGGGSGIGGGAGNPTTSAPPVSSSTAGAAGAQSSSSSSLGTPQVVGTVFGSLAGAALILALLLFLLKRHKQKKQSAPLQLPEDDHADNQPMTQAAKHTSYMAPSFLNRFSGTSRLTTETASTGEKSFQRISGRKLPSAFSEGMTSEQFARGEGTLSGSSFYKDDKGFYGGSGVTPKDFALAKEIGDSPSTGAMGTQELVRPSPARTPIVHHRDDAPVFGASRNGGGSTLSPPLTPNPDYSGPRGTLGRSHPSHDGSRSSRFTENV
ncbi:unnamed protein product [Periconia digitata]|uniref:Uncharacterized protein n=1 Tax=Periconia digitata TaxID=1303443 RepID=A0A9W4XQ19_9PLEO|nr:unnamed protein product [Periconia digitata]